MAVDWSGCPFVLCRPDYLSGTPALRDDPRISAELIVDGSDAWDVRMAAFEVIDDYDLRTPLSDMLAVYDCAVRQRGADTA